MAFQDFVKVEQRRPEGLQIHLVYRRSPSFTVEVQPKVNREGRVCGGTIKRIRIPNSIFRDYARYAKLIAEAEKFFIKSLEDETPARQKTS